MKDNKMRKQYSADSRRRRLLELEDMKKNPSISSSAFEFRPPKGAEILRQ